MLSELIDNSIAHKQPGVPLEIDITITHDDQTNEAVELEIKDNAAGISDAILGDALSPWGMAGVHGAGSISEHGIGMKAAMIGLGSQPKIVTACSSDTHEKVVDYTLIGQVGALQIPRQPKSMDHGTIITIKNFHERGKYLGIWAEGVQGRPIDRLFNEVCRKLGQRYRLLIEDNTVFSPNGLKLHRVKPDGSVVSKAVSPLAPVYLENPHGAPKFAWINQFALAGNTWTATLTFGKAPSKEDWKLHETGALSAEVALSRNKKYDPYWVSADKRGFDLIMNKRVIRSYYLFDSRTKSDDFPSIIGTDKPHPLLNQLRGEIHLLTGFKTNNDKTDVHVDDNFVELGKQISDVLNGKRNGPSGVKIDYMKEIRKRINLDHMEEKHARKKLAKKWGAEGFIGWKGFPAIKEVREELSVSDGRVDIMINEHQKNKEKVCVELKVVEADGQDVYQLLMYMEATNSRHGILCSMPDEDGKLNDGAKSAIEIAKKKRNKWYRPWSNIKIDWISIASELGESVDGDS